MTNDVLTPRSTGPSPASHDVRVRPILFSSPMIRALLSGEKTQTRRILSRSNSMLDGRVWGKMPAWDEFNWATAWIDRGPSPAGNPGPYMKVDRATEETTHRVYSKRQPGDLLWVRENWQMKGLAYGKPSIWASFAAPTAFHYQATDTGEWKKYWGGWRPSIHMPRIASRLTLLVTDVRIERLQDISEEDAGAEGVDAVSMADAPRQASWNRRQDFSQIWDQINGAGAWDQNPWVVAISFSAHKCNVDQFHHAPAGAEGDVTKDKSNV